MKIYISIPVSGKNFENTRHKADLIKSGLSKNGNVAISPFDIYAGKFPTYEDILCYNLRAMLDCDAIFFCEGWEASCGCNIEHETAMRFKAHGRTDFKIMYEQQGLKPVYLRVTAGKDRHSGSDTSTETPRGY